MRERERERERNLKTQFKKIASKQCHNLYLYHLICLRLLVFTLAILIEVLYKTGLSVKI